MLFVRRALLAVCVLAVVIFAWLWWTRPVKTDMAAYVPADSIIYVEADSLPDIFNAVTSTDSWRELALAAGVKTQQSSGWLTQFISFTGLGTSDAVVLARAQVAVTVLGFDAAEESDTTLKFSPRAALVAETHTSEWRVKAAVEKLLGDFARRSFGAATVERKEVDGVQFVTWTAEADERRKIVAAVFESVAVVGNDEGVVRACLDVRRGARQSLAANGQLKEMRARLRSDGALAFGFAPQGSAAKVVEVLAPAFVGSVAENTHIQSLLATLLPQLTNRVVGSAGWISRVEKGVVEDDYFLSLPGDIPKRLQAPLSAAAGQTAGASALLPPDVYQFSSYEFQNPEAAWRGLNAALSSQVDVAMAMGITQALDGMLKTYGVEHPLDFLRACGTELATARLDDESGDKILVASVRDRDALLTQVRAHLGRAARTEHVGDADIIISEDTERGAASFVGDYLLMGSEDDVRRCLAAHAGGRTLQNSAAFKGAAQNFFDEPPFALTLTDERDSTRSTLSYLARGGDKSAGNQAALEEALARRGYSVSQTRLADGGFEKRTRSPFGLFGEIVTRFAPQ